MNIGGDKIAVCLWYDDKAEEAARFYASIFPKSRILAVTRYGPESAKASGRPEGTVMTVTFRLAGKDFMALNGGPVFTFSNAISLVVYCKTQKELDRYWDKLSEGGKVEQCGWLKDKYGLSWQIVPSVLGELMKKAKPDQANRMMAAVMKMIKLDIAVLKSAYKGDA